MKLHSPHSILQVNVNTDYSQFQLAGNNYADHSYQFRKEIIVQLTHSLFTHLFQNNALKKKTVLGLLYKYVWLKIVIRGKSLRNLSDFVRLDAKFILQNQTELIRCTAKTLHILTMRFALNNRHENRILTAPPCPIGLCSVSRYYIS